MNSFVYSKDNSLNPDSFMIELGQPMMKYDFSIKSKDFISSGEATTKVKKQLKELGIDAVPLRRFAVASYEAEINVVAHSIGGKMEVGIYSEFVYLKFIDNGPGIVDIEKAMQPGYSTADDLARSMGFGAGMGLPNIKDNVDIMRLFSDGYTKLELVVFY